jgi:Spx/MgsR family transcriptional regulator
MKVIVYGIRNCDTMKKARDWLEARRIGYVFHDYKTSGIDSPTLENWSTRVGWEALLNRAGTTFRKLPEVQRQDLTAQRAIALMCEQPSMIKRPVLDAGAMLVVGFQPERYAAIFKPEF